jgi:hypothetical protein
LARNQPEVIRLIQSGASLDLSIDEATLDEQLNKRAHNRSHDNNTPPGYPLAIAAGLFRVPGVLEAIGERKPARLRVTDSDNKPGAGAPADRPWRQGLEPPLSGPHGA